LCYSYMIVAADSIHGICRYASRPRDSFRALPTCKDRWDSGGNLCAISWAHLLATHCVPGAPAVKQRTNLTSIGDMQPTKSQRREAKSRITPQVEYYAVNVPQRSSTAGLHCLGRLLDGYPHTTFIVYRISIVTHSICPRATTEVFRHRFPASLGLSESLSNSSFGYNVAGCCDCGLWLGM